MYRYWSGIYHFFDSFGKWYGKEKSGMVKQSWLFWSFWVKLGSPNADRRSQINGKIAQATLKTTIFGPKNSFQAEIASNELIMSDFGACEAHV